MLKYQINKKDLITDQQKIYYSEFLVEDIDFIDETKTLVTCYYNNDIDIKEGDYVVAVYDEPVMGDDNLVTTRSRFREYKVEGVDTDERTFTLVCDKYCNLKGSYLSKETVRTYEDKIISASEYDSIDIADPEKEEYSVYEYAWDGNERITIGEWNNLENDYKKDWYVDCYSYGGEFISMWERFGAKEVSVNPDTGELIETDPYENFTLNSSYKILSPYLDTIIDTDAYDRLEDYEKECYRIDSYIYPLGDAIDTEYLYVWFNDLHYFKENDNKTVEIEIFCDDIPYLLTKGEVVNPYGLRFLLDENNEDEDIQRNTRYADIIYTFFEKEHLYPTERYIEPVEGTEVLPHSEDNVIVENLGYIVARIDNAKIRRYDIVFVPNSVSEDTNVTLFLKKFMTSISVPLTNKFSTDMYHENNIKEKFVDVEVKKAINGYVEMEKDVYHPVIHKVENNEEIFENIKEIRFNLHFRQHTGDDWTATNDSFWNGTYIDDNNVLRIMNSSNSEEYGYFGYTNKSEQSDLLYYLNFNNNDIKYQKNILKKSFLRLSFYDSPNPTTQNLLNYSTIFMDAGNLFGKFTRNFLKGVEFKSGKHFYYSRLVPFSKTGETKVKLEGIRVDREVFTNNPDYNVEDYRLSSQFSVKDRYSSLASSDGFYLYLWKDNDMGFTPSDIYLKVEFNHAAYGRTIPFMMPYDKDSKTIKSFERIVEDWNGDGYGIREYIRYSYIHFKYRYDKNAKRHVYYLDDDQYGRIKLDKNNVLNINLWEAKVK